MKRTKYLLVAVAILAATSVANAAVITTAQVTAMRALYYTNWGHPYTETWDGVTRESNERSGLGRGVPARAAGMPFDPQNFASYSSIRVAASGKAAINGTFSYNANGVGGPPWRGLRLYSLIGIWSSSPTNIVPIGTQIFVGRTNTLSVPNVPQAYLFLGFNDGIFADNFDPPLNGGSGYSVTFRPNGRASIRQEPLATASAHIPEPSIGFLLATGLGLLVAARHRATR